MSVVVPFGTDVYSGLSFVGIYVAHMRLACSMLQDTPDRTSYAMLDMCWVDSLW